MYKLAQLEDKRTTLDNVAWYVHWQLCGKTELEWEDQWYNYAYPRESGRKSVQDLKFYGISMNSVIGWLKLQGWTSSSFMISRQRRLRS